MTTRIAFMMTMGVIALGLIGKVIANLVPLVRKLKAEVEAEERDARERFHGP